MKIIEPDPILKEMDIPLDRLLLLQQKQQRRYEELLKENEATLKDAGHIRKFWIRRTLLKRSRIEVGLDTDPKCLY